MFVECGVWGKHSGAVPESHQYMETSVLAVLLKHANTWEQACWSRVGRRGCCGFRERKALQDLLYKSGL